MRHGASRILRSSSRFLQLANSVMQERAKAAMLSRFTLRSAVKSNGSFKVRKLLACLLDSRFGGTVVLNRVKPSAQERSTTIARIHAKRVLKPQKGKTREKCDAKKKRAKESNASIDEDEASSMTITPFDRASSFHTLNQSNFTVVRKLASGINGDVFKYKWCCGEANEVVAVKKLRNSSLQVARSKTVDERSLHFQPRFLSPSVEDALTEIGVLSYLSRQPDLSQHLLRMHGVFSDGAFTCLVTEFADGGELFELAASGAHISECSLKQYAWQLCHGVGYLHRHKIGHRDISLENILLKDGVAKVMDFGMAVSTHSPSGVPLRYFCRAGKDFYRPPEMYIPKLARAEVIAPCDGIPNHVKTVEVCYDFLCDVRLPYDAVPGQPCVAEVCGYEVPPADMFALGVCLFMLAFQFPPWEQAQLNNDIFSHFYQCTEKGLESLLKQWGKTPRSNEAMLMMTSLLHPHSSRRPSAASCLESPWLSNRR